MSGFFLSALLAIGMGQMQATTQTASAAAPGTSPEVASKGSISSTPKERTPSSPVITIHGVCSSAKKASSSGKADTPSCTTTISKQEFDSVVNALNAIGPQLAAPQKRVVAEGYANMLVTYEAAIKAGIEHDPRFPEVMRLARMRAIGDMYNAFLLEKARQISSEQIEHYYKTNMGKFEELTMRRIALPRFNQANLKDPEFAAKAQEVAREIQERAAKGEDLDKLQKDAYDALKLQNPPRTTMGPVRRGVYSPEEEKQLFALKPGDVTGVNELPSAFVIYKLESRKTLKLDEAKDEIKQTLVKQKLDEQKHASDKSIKIVYDDQYVGPPMTSAWMPASELKGDKKQGKPEATAQSQKK